MAVFTLRGAILSLLALGGASYLITLGVGAEIGLGCTMQNISAKRRSSTVCPVPIVLYGAVVDGFSKAWMRSCAAWAAASADDTRGIGNVCGGNSTLSLIRVALVLSM